MRFLIGWKIRKILGVRIFRMSVVGFENFDNHETKNYNLDPKIPAMQSM